MTTRTEPDRAASSPPAEAGAAHWLDALLDRMPRRPGELAAPPPGSGLGPVHGDRGLPVVGMGVHMIRHGPAFQLQLLRRHGPVSWWQVFGRRVVAVCGPEAVQEVLANRDKAFVTGWPDVVGPWFDGGLLAMDGPGHLADRRLLQAAYGEPALEGYLRRMVEDVTAGLADWPTGRPVRAVGAIRELSGQMTTRALLGVPYDAGGRQVMRDVEACIRAESALLRLALPGTAWHRAGRARRRLAARLARAVPQARVRADDDFLSVVGRLVGPDGGRLTLPQVVDHMIFTLIASHDTTTAATVAAVYFLGKHPGWQRRARAESNARGDAPLDVAGLHRLETLELVVKESVRLVSPSPILMRRAVRDTDVLGHHVPAGQLVSVCTGVNQLLPELWPDPHRFDPERFAEARGEDRVHRLAWAPFGAGQHKCVGMHFGMLKVKATLDALLRRFEWSFPASYTARWRFTSLPAPADGLPVVLRPAPGRPGVS
ncbi:cytochrome P450 [Micromonospora rubida]|uniref:Cytochrome P450 n=1 Tax=Micromonospora rubida TaxID=2697657 RepID=A0ABW7SSI1_9ACTN